MIQFRFVYGFLPAIILFTNKFISDRFAGYNYGIINIIRPDYQRDEGLITHELTHTKQFYRTLGLSEILRLFSKIPCLKKIGYYYIFKYECEAYAEQLKKYSTKNLDKNLELFAFFVSTKYGLPDEYSKTRAKQKILEYYRNC